jgi:hypothetical protein
MRMSKGERLFQWTIGIWGLFALIYALQAYTAHAGGYADVAIARPRLQLLDNQEPNDTSLTGRQISFQQCSVSSPLIGLTIYTTATFAGGNPANDLDYFFYNVPPQRILFITATISTPSVPTDDLSLSVEVRDNPNPVFPISSFVVYTTSPGRSGSASFYVPNGGTFYILVKAFNSSTLFDSQFKPYQLRVCHSDNVVTPTPPPPPTPVGANPDPYEPNDLPSVVQGQTPIRSFVNVGQQLTNLNFYTQPNTNTLQFGDVDWYFFYGRGGAAYRVTTEVQPGVDTELFIYRPDQLPPDNNFTAVGLLASNDDYQPLSRASQATFVAPFDGLFWIKVWNKDQAPRVAGQTYNLSVVELAPNTPTPTNTPLPTFTPTPFPAGADQYEYNGDFDFATLIAPGVKLSGLTFVPFQPPSPNTVDNDFFKLPVKQGVFYTCETQDLAGGADTNIIVYNQDRVGIGGNDDISPEDKAQGRFQSRFSWLSAYTGYAYVLVGDVNPPRAGEAQARSYSLICNIGLPATPTPTPDPNPPTATPPPLPPTPLPPEPTLTPFPTPRAAQNLVVQRFDARPTLAPPGPTPTPRLLIIDVHVFNDYNRNNLLDAGEGIARASVRLADERTGTPLAQGFTDADGRARFPLSNDGPVRVNVPAFNFSTVVTDSVTLRIGIEPRIAPPARIP